LTEINQRVLCHKEQNVAILLRSNLQARRPRSRRVVIDGRAANLQSAAPERAAKAKANFGYKRHHQHARGFSSEITCARVAVKHEVNGAANTGVNC